MPIYEYFCKPCDQKFEMKRLMSESDKDASCPVCSFKSKRILSRFSSFSKNSAGESIPVAGTGSSCGGCSSPNCGTCGM